VEQHPPGDRQDDADGEDDDERDEGGEDEAEDLVATEPEAWRTLIFSSRATWTAAIREMAPPKTDQIRGTRP